MRTQHINFKKPFYLTLGAIVLVILVGLASVFVLKALQVATPTPQNTSSTPNASPPTSAQADKLQLQAAQAIKDKDFVKAKALYQQARDAYVKLNNLDAVADIDNQLYKLDHPEPSPTPVKPVLLISG